MLYLDTSLVLSVLIVEASSVRIGEWLASQPSGQTLVSDWVLSETASALSLKQRLRTLDVRSRARSAHVLRALLVDTLSLVPVERSAFQAAALMCEQPDLGLRAPDALHLAVASQHGAVLCTRDVQQFEAGRRLGVATELIGDRQP